MTNQLTYALVTPARDEAAYLSGLADCIIGQTQRPLRWVIADDGSTDGTAELADKLQSHYPWIRVHHIPNRGYRLRGKGHVEAILAGVDLLKDVNYDLLAKLDGDMLIENNYFAQLASEFQKDLKLGIAGGSIVVEYMHQWKVDRQLPTDFVRGATKMYRRACWDEIDGIIPHKGWDGIDNVKAILAGWTVYRFDDLEAKHLRDIGLTESPLRRGYMAGLDSYFTGGDPLFFTVRAFKRLLQNPPVVFTGAMLWGYFGSWLIGKPRVQDKAVMNYMRKRERELLKQRKIHN